MTTETALKMLLKSFHLPAFVDNYEDVARKAEKEGSPCAYPPPEATLSTPSAVVGT